MYSSFSPLSLTIASPQHLWTWRCACKKSGKRISKSLLQARAKWAFRKAGIAEFKVSVVVDKGEQSSS